MVDTLEQRAREIAAAEYTRCGFDHAAANVLAGTYSKNSLMDATVCSAKAALQQAQQPDTRDERIAELERQNDATYVQRGADAYNHACEEMERFQAERIAAGKDAGCEGSLCDGMSWLYSRIAELEAQQPAYPDWELIGYEYQQEETGLTTFVDAQQVEWGFEKNNPRHQRVGPCYRPSKKAQQQVAQAVDLYTLDENAHACSDGCCGGCAYRPYTHPQPPSIPEPSSVDAHNALTTWNRHEEAETVEFGEGDFNWARVAAMRDILATYTARLRERIGGGS